jgi:hypothetical protein
MVIIYHLELRDQDTDLLLHAGADPSDGSSVIGTKKIRYAVFATSAYATLDQWRLLLNREGRPYRYCECDGQTTRELGRSRSPDWCERV